MPAGEGAMGQVRQILLAGLAAVALAPCALAQTGPTPRPVSLGQALAPPTNVAPFPCATPEELQRLNQLLREWNQAYQGLKAADRELEDAMSALVKAEMAEQQAKSYLSIAENKVADLQDYVKFLEHCIEDTENVPWYAKGDETEKLLKDFPPKLAKARDELTQAQADLARAQQVLQDAAANLKAATQRETEAMEARAAALDRDTAARDAFLNAEKLQRAKKCPPPAVRFQLPPLPPEEGPPRTREKVPPPRPPPPGKTLGVAPPHAPKPAPQGPGPTPAGSPASSSMLGLGHFGGGPNEIAGARLFEELTHADGPPTGFEKPPCASPEDLAWLEDLLKAWRQAFNRLHDAAAARDIALSELHQAQEAEELAAERVSSQEGRLTWYPNEAPELAPLKQALEKAQAARKAADEKVDKAFKEYWAALDADHDAQNAFNADLAALKAKKCPPAIHLQLPPPPEEGPPGTREKVPPAEPPGKTIGLAPTASPTVCTLSNFETGVLADINQARTNPPGAIPILTLSYGPAARAETASFLGGAPAVPALTCDPRLEAAAHRQLDDQGPKGGLGHTGSDGSSPGQRMQQAGDNASTYGEEISASFPTPGGMVSELLIDASNPGHFHRFDLTSPIFIEVGLACGPNSQWKIMCVIDLSSLPLAPASTPPPPPP
jgi:uncharacterized protein YkwD